MSVPSMDRIFYVAPLRWVGWIAGRCWVSGCTTVGPSTPCDRPFDRQLEAPAGRSRGPFAGCPARRLRDGLEQIVVGRELFADVPLELAVDLAHAALGD